MHARTEGLLGVAGQDNAWDCEASGGQLKKANEGQEQSDSICRQTYVHILAKKPDLRAVGES
jgi:hypothetical protein